MIICVVSLFDDTLQNAPFFSGHVRFLRTVVNRFSHNNFFLNYYRLCCRYRCWGWCWCWLRWCNRRVRFLGEWFLWRAHKNENECLGFRLGRFSILFTSGWVIASSSSSKSPCSSEKSGNSSSTPFSVGNWMSGNGGMLGLCLATKVLIKLQMSSRFLVTTMASNQFINCLMGNR